MPINMPPREQGTVAIGFNLRHRSAMGIAKVCLHAAPNLPEPEDFIAAVEGWSHLSQGTKWRAASSSTTNMVPEQAILPMVKSLSWSETIKKNLSIHTQDLKNRTRCDMMNIFSRNDKYLSIQRIFFPYFLCLDYLIYNNIRHQIKFSLLLHKFSNLNIEGILSRDALALGVLVRGGTWNSLGPWAKSD